MCRSPRAGSLKGLLQIRDSARPLAHIGSKADRLDDRRTPRRLRIRLGQLGSRKITCAAFGAERSRTELLSREDAGLIGLVAEQEGFVAYHVEQPIEILDARGTLLTAAVRLDHLQPTFDAIVVESGADLAGRFQLEMAIVRVPGADADAVEDPPRVFTSLRRSIRFCTTSRRGAFCSWPTSVA